MKRVNAVLLLVISLLIGCESDFDKCMNTELPRAEAVLNIESEREARRELVFMKDLHQKVAKVNEGLYAFIDRNPDYSEEVGNLYDQEVKRLLNESGLSVKDEQEFWDLEMKLETFYDAVLKPRSCIYQTMNEVVFCQLPDGMSDGHLMEQSFDEAILYSTKFLETAKQAAVVTCNTNGFYE